MIAAPKRAPRRPSRIDRGLSLVELMVGVTIGLFVVAAATVMVSGQLGENRRLLLETQLQQDLRATADIITRELRRTGALLRPQKSVSSATFTAEENARGATTPASGPSSNVTFKYERTASEVGDWGYKLEGGVIKTQLASPAGWQDLTDGAVMVVESFTINIERSTPQQLPCPALCSGGGTDCWPVMYVRDFVVDITARARNTPDGAPIRRSVRSTVRARNDWVEFKLGASPTVVCPA